MTDFNININVSYNTIKLNDNNDNDNRKLNLIHVNDDIFEPNINITLDLPQQAIYNSENAVQNLNSTNNSNNVNVNDILSVDNERQSFHNGNIVNNTSNEQSNIPSTSNKHVTDENDLVLSNESNVDKGKGKAMENTSNELIENEKQKSTQFNQNDDTTPLNIHKLDKNIPHQSQESPYQSPNNQPTHQHTQHNTHITTSKSNESDKKQLTPHQIPSTSSKGRSLEQSENEDEERPLKRHRTLPYRELMTDPQIRHKIDNHFVKNRTLPIHKLFFGPVEIEKLSNLGLSLKFGDDFIMFFKVTPYKFDQRICKISYKFIRELKMRVDYNDLPVIAVKVEDQFSHYLSRDGENSNDFSEFNIIDHYIYIYIDNLHEKFDTNTFISLTKTLSKPLINKPIRYFPLIEAIEVYGKLANGKLKSALERITTHINKKKFKEAKYIRYKNSELDNNEKYIWKISVGSPQSLASLGGRFSSSIPPPQTQNNRFFDVNGLSISTSGLSTSLSPSLSNNNLTNSLPLHLNSENENVVEFRSDELSGCESD